MKSGSRGSGKKKQPAPPDRPASRVRTANTKLSGYQLLSIVRRENAKGAGGNNGGNKGRKLPRGRRLRSTKELKAAKAQIKAAQQTQRRKRERM